MSVELYHGDCLEFMRTLPTGSVDAVVTDPPFSEVTHQGARTAKRRQGEYWRKDPGSLVDFSAFDMSDMYEAFNLIGTTVKTWVVSFVDWHFMQSLESKPPTGLRFVRFGIWVKPNGAPQFTGDRPGTGWEAIAIMHKDGPRMRWNGGGHHAVWGYNKAHQDSYPGDHPTVKALPLITDIVLKFTDPGDTILDPFMGSGTTGVACVQTGRSFIGCEIDRGYFEIAQRRIAQAEAQPRLLPLDAPRPTQEEMTL